MSENQKLSGKKNRISSDMGYLHEGHLALVREAVKSCDVVIVSILLTLCSLVQGEDFEQYPRDLTRDLSLLQKRKCTSCVCSFSQGYGIQKDTAPV